MKEPELKQETSSPPALFFGGIFMLGIAGYLLHHTFNQPYIQVPSLVLGLIFLFSSLFLIAEIIAPGKTQNRGLTFFQIACLAIGGLTLYSIPSQFQKQNESNYYTYDKMVQIRDKVIENSSYKGDVTMRLESFPDFKFQLNRHAFAEGVDGRIYRANVKAGDSVEVLIYERDFYSKIKKSIEPLFIDKIVNYEFIDIYELREGKEVYLSLDDFIKNDGGSSVSPWVSIVFGTILFPLGLTIFVKEDS